MIKLPHQYKKSNKWGDMLIEMAKTIDLSEANMKVNAKHTQRIDEFIDSQPISRLQKRVIILCFTIVALDGLDTSCIAFLGPAIRTHWNLTAASALAPLFGAGLAGLMIGALCLGPVADRIGRKKVLELSVFLFGAASLVSAFSPTLDVLIFMRFITGVGLGGAMPTAITLTSEFCPSMKRSALVTLMFCGFALGGAAGGVVTANFVELIGWQGVLVVGGALPFALVPLLLMLLPESMHFLLLSRTQKNYNQVIAIASRIVAGGEAVPNLYADEAAAKTSVKAIFAPGVILGTGLLWLTFFMTLLSVYLLNSWMPVLLSSVGIPLKQASLVLTMYQIGAGVGAIWLGRQMDKFDPQRVLALSNVGAACAIAICAFSGSSVLLVTSSVFCIGFFLSGGVVGGYALAAAYYSTAVRATGVAWSNAAGRVGSVVGSMIGGTMMDFGMELRSIILMLVIPTLLATCSLLALQHLRDVRNREVPAETSSPTV
ncbi:MFS transporter [Burkholderia anthina]|uniref:MFS transporter n=1 Tax=Burkholderia anthina TaxID=179879 RepID=UPI00272A1844